MKCITLSTFLFSYKYVTVWPLMDEGIHAAIVAERVYQWMGVPITNTILMSWVVILTLLLITFLIRTRLSLVPSKIQLIFELLFDGILEFMTETLGSRKLAKMYFPLIVTLFLFIFTGNMLEFIPGVGSIGYIAHNMAIAGTKPEFTPVLRSMNTDLNVTLALAIIVFLVIEISGIIMVGFFRYFSRFFNFHSFVGFFVGIIEFVSEFIRLISFSFRLFGNIFAGEVLISVAAYFLPFVGPVPFMAYEVFVGFIQATIFSLLTLFFLKLAITEAEH